VFVEREDTVRATADNSGANGKLSTNQKGGIAETKIAAAATELGVPVLRPIVEHGRYDLAFEIAGRILRVQCKWGSLDEDRAVIRVNLQTSWLSTDGYVLSPYAEDEIDLVAMYCGDLNRCYLLPCALVAGRRAIHLRLTPPRNGQQACINLASEFEFSGAVAQLEERLNGIQEARGSSPLSSTPSQVDVGCNAFRNHFGLYLERAGAGDEIRISRHGRPYARLVPAQPLLAAGWISD
jgi:prevent-host-death family protein